MTTTEQSIGRHKVWRYLCFIIGGMAAIIAIFYGEEDWRGWQAFTKCKRELAAQGVNLSWRSYVPALVPDDENVFGVPEIQTAFTGRGARSLLNNWPKPGAVGGSRMVAARLIIGLPGSSSPPGWLVVNQGGANGSETISNLIKGAFGPVAVDPAGPFYLKNPSAQIRPAEIYWQCQQQPTDAELKKTVPPRFFEWDQDEKVEVESQGDGSYNVTMNTPATVADYLKRMDATQSDLNLLRNALQRPYARMGGDYKEPSQIPIPNFVTMRTVAQRLGASAQCHLLLGQPGEALLDLTLVHDLCRRILEENSPMTLMSAMINVAVRGLATGIIDDGLERHDWREPQLAELESQLAKINLLVPVQDSFEKERAFMWFELDNKSPAQLYKIFSIDGNSKRDHFSFRKQMWELMPHGWVYQNFVTGANIYASTLTFMDPVNSLVFPAKWEAADKRIGRTFSHWSPNTFLAAMMIPNFKRAVQTTAKNQTRVNHTLIACALERYHLAHNEYPGDLNVLVPQFIDAIPHDVIGGKPPQYHRNGDGTFLLYSVGWDEQDHGGLKGVDWVWPDKGN